MSGQPTAIARGVLWMMGGVFSFSAMAVSGREAGQILSTADLLVWRSFIGVLVSSIIVAFSARGFAQVHTRKLPQHFIRNIFHYFGQYCWYYAVLLIPFAQLFALEFTAPIWVICLAPVFLGERFTRWKALAVVLGFSGVLLIVQPDGLSFGEGQIWGLLAAVGFAGNLIATKRLSETESSLCVIFYMAVLQTPMGLIVAGGFPAIPPDAHTAFWVAVLGLGGLSAHYCMTQAFKCADATIVIPIDFARLPLIAVIGMLAYSEPLEVVVFIGGAMIFLGNYLNIWSSSRAKNRQ